MGYWIGGARRDRTADLLRATQALSQLSYSPKKIDYISPLYEAIIICYI